MHVAGGDALVFGEALSAPGGMDRIRSRMGVCPQFDILWKELTGREHLRIYGAIKVGLLPVPLLRFSLLGAGMPAHLWRQQCMWRSFAATVILWWGRGKQANSDLRAFTQHFSSLLPCSLRSSQESFIHRLCLATRSKGQCHQTQQPVPAH
jgi:hypothetical protein